MDEKLTEINLSDEKDELARLNIDLKKSKFGCGGKHYVGNYISAIMCTENNMCDDCTNNIDSLESQISHKETLILGITLSRNGELVKSIKTILSNKDFNQEQQLDKIRSIVT